MATAFPPPVRPRKARQSPTPSQVQRSRCRICGSTRCEPVGSVAEYEFLACPDCAFVFAPAVTPASAASAYGRDGRERAPDIGWADMEFLDPALARLSPEPLRVLDFGCGQSVAPERLRKMGHRVIAADLAPPRRPHTDRLTGPLEDLDLPPRSFDLVYSFQVFEHLPKPRPVFDHLLRLVRSGGLLLIHTDMETEERAGGLESWWYVMPPEHCAFYRHRTFEALTEASPHRIIARDPKSVLIQALHDGEESESPERAGD